MGINTVLKSNLKNKRDRKLGRIYLFLFFLFVGIHKIDGVLVYYSGISLKDFTIITPLFIPPVFLLLAVLKYRKIHFRTRITAPLNSFYLLAALFIFYILFLTVYGFLVGNPMLYIFTEVWIYLIVALCMFLGFYDAVWEDMYKPLVVLFWVFFIPVYIGTFIPRLHLLESGNAAYMMEKFGSLRGTGTMAYEIYPILDFFPIVFLLSIVRKKIDVWKLLGLCTILGYLGLQIFFQKRAPSVRALTYIAVVFMTLQLVKPSIVKLVKLAIPVTIGLFFLVSFVSIDGLVDRLSNSEGDTARQSEAMLMLSQLEPYEWILGRGFGGYFVLGTVRERVGLGEYEIKEGITGKVNLHIAFFYPILKGGVTFLLLTLLLSFPMMYRWMDKRWLREGNNFAAFNILVVIFLYQFIEGPFSSGVTFLGVLYGLCWGRMATSLNQFSLR